jgi:hypothetical protein
MPFIPDPYRRWCSNASTAQLEADLRSYTKQVAAGAAGAGTGLALSIFTFGISLIGTAAGTAMAANAGQKMEIIKDELRRREHTTLIRGTDLASGFGSGMAGGMAGGAALS